MNHKKFWRNLLTATLLSGAAALVHPVPAMAAGKKIVVWWNQGFYPAEDQALKDTVAAWEKATGNTVELTIYNGADLPAKIVSAITTGDVAHEVARASDLLPERQRLSHLLVSQYTDAFDPAAL